MLYKITPFYKSLIARILNIISKLQKFIKTFICLQCLEISIALINSNSHLDKSIKIFIVNAFYPKQF